MANEEILIVDDNATNLKLVAVLLKSKGYTVYTAEDAEIALKMLEELLPRLILMDIQLPGMDGLELTRLLKANPKYQKITIVAVTSYAMKGDEQKALDAGCDYYISKPIDVKNFPDMIVNFIAGSKQ